MKETEIIDLAAGQKRGLRAWLTRRRLTPKQKRELEQTQALFAELQGIATEFPSDQPDFATEAAQLPRKKPTMRKLLLPGLATIAILSVSILPLTRPLVQEHLKVLLGGAPPYLDRPKDQKESLDYRLQLFHALNQASYSNPAPALPELRALIQRYPEKPELRALALNVLTNLYRDAAGRGTAKSTKSSPPKQLPPDELALGLADAAVGTRLAPDNALFPLLKTTLLLAAGKDEDALRAFQEAAQTSGWDDYREIILQAGTYRVRQQNPKLGVPNVLAVMAALTYNALNEFGESISLPAPFVIEQLAEREKAGKRVEAWALRDALFNLGSRIHQQSGNYLDSVWGSTMALRSADQPGGAPPLPQKLTAQDARHDRTTAALTRFAPYAKEQGHPERAQQLQQVLHQRDQQKNLVHSTDTITPSIKALALHWGSLVLLVWTLWLILCGGLAYVLNQTRRVRETKPLHPAIGWGIPLSLVLPGLVGQSLTNVRVPDGVFPIAALLLVIGAGLHLYTTKRGSETYRGNLLVLLLSMLTTLGMIGAAGYLFSGAAFFSPAPIRELGALQAATTGAIAGGLALAFPIGSAIVFSLMSVKRRIPASVGIVRGFRRNAVPIACVLVCVYALLTPFVALNNIEQEVQLALFLKHEGHYIARVAGKPWP